MTPGWVHLYLVGEESTKSAIVGLVVCLCAPREHRLKDGVARAVVRAPRQQLVHNLLERQRRVAHAARRGIACAAHERRHAAKV